MVDLPTACIPYVNDNGTAEEALLSSFIDAMHALHGAIDAVKWTEPRRFDWRNDKDFKLAREYHEQRVEKLISVRSEINAIIEGLIKQEKTVT